MVSALKDRNLVRYVAAAGVLAHYVGDACQPLHVSMLHDGEPGTGRGAGVHSAYETRMLDRFAPDLNALIELLPRTPLQDITSGKAAAQATVDLMRRSIREVPPERLIEVYEGNSPVTVYGLKKAVAITAGYVHTCAALQDGSLKCWGADGTGESGPGTNSPVPVLGL